MSSKSVISGGKYWKTIRSEASKDPIDLTLGKIHAIQLGEDLNVSGELIETISDLQNKVENHEVSLSLICNLVGEPVATNLKIKKIARQALGIEETGDTIDFNKDIEEVRKRKVIVHPGEILEIKGLTWEQAEAASKDSYAVTVPGLSCYMHGASDLIFTIPMFQDEEAFILKSRLGVRGRVSIATLEAAKIATLNSYIAMQNAHIATLDPSYAEAKSRYWPSPK